MAEPPHQSVGRPHPAGDRVDRALILRLRIYLAIFGIATVLTVVDVVRQASAAVVPVALGTVCGIVLGVLASRVSRLSWDRDAGKVVGRVDGLGAAVLVGYVLLVVFKKRLLAQWFEPSLVGVVGVAVLAGLMLGQAVGTAGGIARVLHAALGSTPESTTH